MRKKALSIFYMFLITLFFASLVSAVKYFNENKIKLNQTIKLQRIILKVLDIPIAEGTTGEGLFELFKQRVKEIQIDEKKLYIGYEQDGRTIQGYALPVGGPGFWGPIKGMVGIDPDGKRILGIAFYQHNETPGLGGRITENWFSNQFKGLSLFPIKGEENIFYLSPPGTDKRANELDAITGATNTSSAVEEFLNQELDIFLKNLWPTLEEKN
jgi:Na+-transporting NADH:ubiquinone oxidoreductase subunit C